MTKFNTFAISTAAIDDQTNAGRRDSGVFGHLFATRGEGEKAKTVLQPKSRSLALSYIETGLDRVGLTGSPVVVGTIKGKGPSKARTAQLRKALDRIESFWESLTGYEEKLKVGDTTVTLTGEAIHEAFVEIFGEKRVDPEIELLDGTRRFLMAPVFRAIDNALERDESEEWPCVTRDVANRFEWIKAANGYNVQKGRGSKAPVEFDKLHSGVLMLNEKPRMLQSELARTLLLNAGQKQRIFSVAHLIRNHPDVESLQALTPEVYSKLNKEDCRKVAVRPTREPSWEKDNAEALASVGLTPVSKGNGGSAYTKAERKGLIEYIEPRVRDLISKAVNGQTSNQKVGYKKRIENNQGSPVEILADFCNALLIDEDDKREAEIAALQRNAACKNAYVGAADDGTTLIPAPVVKDPETGEDRILDQAFFNALDPETLTALLNAAKVSN